jgi:hypothetical protein
MLFALLSILMVAPAVARPQPSAPSLANAPKKIHRNAHGSVRQVVPDQPIPPPGRHGASDDPGAAAGAQAADIGRLFGAGAGTRLVVGKVSRRGRGSAVRLEQRIGSIPVYGAGVALALRPDGSLLSATGALAEQTSGGYPADGTTPTPTARSVALGAVAGLAHVAADRLRVRAASAAWYDPDLSGADRPERVAVPAYRYDIAAGDGVWRAFVAAGPAADVLDAWQVEEDLNRVICDADFHGDERKLEVPCGAADSYAVVRTEGSPAVAGNDDANAVYDWVGDTEKFYARYTDLGGLTDLIGIDATDDRGRALRAHVRVCVSACPYANAYWTDATGFVMGTAVLGLDVVAHELTHGVTEQTSGLDYRNESGAINESMSDVFGELTELATTTAKHVRADRWKIGNGTSLGVIRDMKSPGSTTDPQPEIYRGPRWVPATYSDRNRVPDLGGVHTNSGVGNKLAYLITDGDTFNGRTVTGLGIEKVAALYWTVQTLLYPSADYSALASTLLTACHHNAEDKVAGLTQQDCAEVRKAIEAVRIPVREERA